MIHNFQEEFELIQNDRIREFAVEAVQKLSEEAVVELNVDYVKRVVAMIQQLCDVADADDPVRDVMTVAALIHYGAYDGTLTYPMRTRLVLQPLMGTVGREAFGDILYLVERQLGYNSPFPEYHPQIDSPIHAWLLPIAINLSKE